VLRAQAEAQRREEEIARICLEYGVSKERLLELRAQFRRQGRALGFDGDMLTVFMQRAEMYYFLAARSQ
jgi:hypothetical protein